MRLPATANRADAPRGRRLGLLAAGVGIDLGVKHEDVDLGVHGDDMVQAAETDVVGPAVAADNPDGFFDQRIGQDVKAGGVRRGKGVEGAAQFAHALALLADSASCPVWPSNCVGQFKPDFAGRVCASVRARIPFVCPEPMRWPKPYSALSSKSELDQAGPRPSLLTCVGSGRQVAAVNGGAAGGVGNDQAVAGHLREQLDVRRFAAAGTGAGEFEERLAELRAFDIHRQPRAVGGRQVEEEFKIDLLLLAQRRASAPC
jgi:hypothetical protein